MGLTMGQRRAVTKAIATRYTRASRVEKGRILDEPCATSSPITGANRLPVGAPNTAQQNLNATTTSGPYVGVRGRRVRTTLGLNACARALRAWLRCQPVRRNSNGSTHATKRKSSATSSMRPSGSRAASSC